MNLLVLYGCFSSFKFVSEESIQIFYMVFDFIHYVIMISKFKL